MRSESRFFGANPTISHRKEVLFLRNRLLRETRSIKEAPQNVKQPDAATILGIGGVNLDSEVGWIELVRRGIAMKGLLKLLDYTSITFDEMAAYTHTQKFLFEGLSQNALLSPEISERIVEIANVYSKGAHVFGNVLRFNGWMKHPSVVLGNIQPKELLDTSFGIRMLLDELGRMEHGIFA